MSSKPINKIKIASQNGEEIQEISFGKYSGGEIYINETICLEYPVDAVQVRIESADDILALLLLNNALNRLHLKDSHVLLYIPYFPYARQDRIVDEGVNQSLSVEVMADLINMMNFDTVIISDPHSDVAPALLKNVKIVEQLRTLEPYLSLLSVERKIPRSDIVLVAPDAGALKKTYAFAAMYDYKNVISAEKKRDVATGQITGTVIHGEIHPGKHYVMLDDICDGGRTFTAIAKAIREADLKAREEIVNNRRHLANLELKTLGEDEDVSIIPATTISLAVTHGIFCYGIHPLMDGGIDEVYAYNPWTEYVENINIFEKQRTTFGIFKNTRILFSKT